jgi:DNA-directed RNA polymerase specialized sigma24 family protein
MADDAIEWVTTSTVLARLSDFEDRGAWERFADRFQRPIQVFAERQGLARAECEDVAQDTLLAFAQAYRDGGYDRARGRLSHWLFGIAWRRIDHARRRARVRAGEAALGAHEDDPSWSAVAAPHQPSPEWEEVWERTMLEQCLRQVRKEVTPPTFRAFEMLVLESGSIEDAVRELGITRNAVAIAKHRVSERVRALVRECDEVMP